LNTTTMPPSAAPACPLAAVGFPPGAEHLGQPGTNAASFPAMKGAAMTSRRVHVRGRRWTLIALLLAASSVLPASAARADLIPLAACDTPAVSQPFKPWADPAFYELTAGGDFEHPAWGLAGGAFRARGSEPYAATGKVGNWSVALPAASSAQSPRTCVDAAYPSVRFFIAGTGSVAVSLVYGGTAIPAGIVAAGSGWSPTPVILTTAPVVTTASGGTAQVSVRITGVSGRPLVDDVYIDPWNRG
jgi:hypothetical protein